MTLAHEPPPSSPPPPAQPVPGLPGHFYQLRPASARQPTPSLAGTPSQPPAQSRAPATPQLFQQQGMQQQPHQQQQLQRQQSTPGSASGLPPRGMTPQRGGGGGGAIPPAPLPQQRGSTPQHRAYPAWEAVARDDTPPISQYEIINEADPVLRQRKRAELAQALQSTYAEQVGAHWGFCLPAPAHIGRGSELTAFFSQVSCCAYAARVIAKRLQGTP